MGPRFLIFHTRLHPLLERILGQVFSYEDTQKLTRLLVRKLENSSRQGPKELHPAAAFLSCITPRDSQRTLPISIILSPQSFFLTQRSKDSGLLFTWLTVAAFLVQTQLV